MGRKRKEIMVEIDKNGCHNCISHAKTEHGYIRLHRGKKLIRLHRYIYEMKYGKIPKGLFACHKCDNRVCLNPEHIFLGDNKDNMNDMMNKNRQARGEKSGMSKLTEKQVYNILISNKPFSFLSKKYNITVNIISKIKNRQIWKHIKIPDFKIKKYDSNKDKRKLSFSDINSVRNSKESSRKLAKKFNTTKSTILRIKNNISYKNMME